MVARATQDTTRHGTPSSTDVSLREYVEVQFAALTTLVEERDRQYSQHFLSGETAVTTALAAQEKSVNTALLAAKEAVQAAFDASEKAIVKAEAAQLGVNERQNEFRASLADQASSLMPRAETTVLFKGIEDRLAAIVSANDSKVEALRAANEKATEANSQDIKSLRETRAQVGGSRDNGREVWGYAIGASGVLIALVTILLRLTGH